MKLLATLLLLCSPVFASRHAPIPESITRAKTVFIVNRTGYKSVAQTAFEQFTRWGRFDVASSKGSADIVAIFSIDNGLRTGNSMPHVKMDIQSNDAEDYAYEATAPWSFFGNATKSCVRHFRKRMETR